MNTVQYLVGCIGMDLMKIKLLKQVQRLTKIDTNMVYAESCVMNAI